MLHVKENEIITVCALLYYILRTHAHTYTHIYFLLLFIFIADEQNI